MGSYNRLNGVYACQHPGILRTLKQDWDWEGFVAPDFLHAVRDPVAAANAGLDIPGLGVPEGRTAEQVTSGAIRRACGWPPTGGPSPGRHRRPGRRGGTGRLRPGSGTRP